MFWGVFTNHYTRNDLEHVLHFWICFELFFLSSSLDVFGCTFEPVSVDDKSAATHCRVWQEHVVPVARDLMSEGIFVECYCFDGGLQSGMNRWHRQHHAAYYHALQQGGDEAGVHLRELTHWILNATSKDCLAVVALDLLAAATRHGCPCSDALVPYCRLWGSKPAGRRHADDKWGKLQSTAHDLPHCLAVC